MAQIADITETDIRKSLIDRAETFCRLNKTSFSAIGLAAVQDSKFLSRVANPEIGFNIKTYQKVVDWLDAEEGKQGAAK